MKHRILVGSQAVFILLFWSSAFGLNHGEALELRSKSVGGSLQSFRNPQSLGHHEDSSSLLQEIKDDVRNMNVGDSSRSPISVLEYAGSSTAEGLMYLPEARLHYPFLVKLLSKSTGYFHHNAMVPGMFNPGANGPQDLTELLIEKFSKGVTVVSMIFGVPNHYVVLAIQADGRIRFIDSLATGYEPLTEGQKANLLNTLKSARILKENGEAVVFQEIEEIYAGQQKDGSNCLIFATLNAFQIARKGAIEGYQEVTASLSADRLSTYYDLTKIGDEATLEVPDYGPDQSYHDFMLSFRNKTQQLIASALNLPTLEIATKNKQPSQPTQMVPSHISSSGRSNRTLERGTAQKKFKNRRQKGKRNAPPEGGGQDHEGKVNRANGGPPG
ncbi:MAG: hypothetical protein ABIQ95_02920, partial [Bdellovibrionia bacterium]